MTDPTAPAPTRRRANTRARILEAAAGVFAEKGLHGATVDDLVSAAGYTRGAFYSNFSTREDVFYALFENQSERMVGLVRDAVETTPPERFDVSLIATILERLRPHAREWHLIQTEFLLHAMRHAEVAERYQEHSARFEREFAEVLDEALRRLGRRPTVPAEQLADVLASLYMKGMAEAAIAGDPGDGAGRAFADQTLPTVLLGLSSPVDD